jgi:hypothetical protein
MFKKNLFLNSFTLNAHHPLITILTLYFPLSKDCLSNCLLQYSHNPMTLRNNLMCYIILMLFLLLLYIKSTFLISYSFLFVNHSFYDWISKNSHNNRKTKDLTVDWDSRSKNNLIGDHIHFFFIIALFIVFHGFEPGVSRFWSGYCHHYTATLYSIYFMTHPGHSAEIELILALDITDFF